MRFVSPILLPLLALAGGATDILAEASRTDINPALTYYRASQLAPDFSAADRDYLFANDWRGQKLAARFGELVSRYDNEFKLVRQAAEASVPCDWGLDWSQGPATVLPHLSRNRAVAQAARLRAMWFLQNGRQAEASEELLAALALARNSSRDGCLISVLVQISMENIICQTIAENLYQFSPETLKRLAEGIDTAPARGLVAACVPVEKYSAVDWFVNRIAELQNEHPGNDRKVMAEMRQLLVNFEGSEEAGTNRPQSTFPEKMERAAGGTIDGLVKLFRDAESYYPKVTEMLNLPSAAYEEAVSQFNAQIQSASNPLLAELFTAWPKCRRKEFAALIQLAMVKSALEYKLQGEAGLQSVSDPTSQSPFAVERFVFAGADRGFQFKSGYEGRGFPEVLIFVEKDGTAFQVSGKNAGLATTKNTAK